MATPVCPGGSGADSTPTGAEATVVCAAAGEAEHVKAPPRRRTASTERRDRKLMVGILVMAVFLTSSRFTAASP
jgi:hypothetical protein